jgi:antitoxin FitA
MAQILVRYLDKKMVERLKRRAKRNARSLQSEVKTMLEQVMASEKLDPKTAHERIVEFRKRFANREVVDSAELIREDRER